MMRGLIVFSGDIGYPQKKRVKINNVVYEFVARFNEFEDPDALILSITEVSTGELLFNKKIPPTQGFEIYSSEHHLPLFTIFCWAIDHDLNNSCPIPHEVGDNILLGVYTK